MLVVCVVVNIVTVVVDIITVVDTTVVIWDIDKVTVVAIMAALMMRIISKDMIMHKQEQRQLSNNLCRDCDFLCFFILEIWSNSFV